MARYFFTLVFLNLLLSFTPLTSAEQKPNLYWQTIQKRMQIQESLNQFHQELCAKPSIHLQEKLAAQSKAWIAQMASLADPFEDQDTAHLIVTSCALSELPQAIELMERVVHPSSCFSAKSWLSALQYLSTQPSLKACELISRSLGMPYYELNVAAALYLSQNPYARSDAQTAARIQALHRRFDKRFSLVIGELYSRLDHPYAAQALRQMTQESDIELQAALLRLAADYSTGDFDDIAYQWTERASPLLQEAALYYSLLKEHVTTGLQDKCLKLIQSPHLNVYRLALLYTIRTTGDRASIEQLARLIHQGDLQAIAGCAWLAKVCSLGLDQHIVDELTLHLSSNESPLQINSALALLANTTPTCLPYLSEIFCNSSCMLNGQKAELSNWLIYSIQPIIFENSEQTTLLLAQQYNTRLWLLEQIARLDFKASQNWYEQLVISCDEPSQYLLSTHLSYYQDPQALQLLLQWQNMPGKPWLRLGAHLSLWKLQKNILHLNELRSWMKKKSDSPSLFLAAHPSNSRSHFIDNWLTDFQTRVLLDVTQEVWKSQTPESLMAIIEKMQSMILSPNLAAMIAILSKD